MTQRSRLRWNGQAVNRDARQGAARGLRIGLEHLLQVSRDRVPIEEGTLERSGTVTVDEAALEGAVSYDTPYAVRQHEDLDLRHDEGRTAQFLADPLDEERDVILDLIAAQVRRSLRG
ncbi:hypothetical protein [Streptomyces griseoloalbus]|uniref:Uncharacterized protein n=1 Tax=Streptomyces griseoloalbus TaxID=67303 RepID=A0A7W8BS55_9ACTN|nr:hypothetical protein [Streptomyces albaduncus]MBB5128445.1 hypothetical protein [Streptomyces albaduncus]GGW67923.1 hypothetical protein GCM10010340_52560 [Streptomyces albaduncus]